MLSEISKSEKDNYHMVSFICGISNSMEDYGAMEGHLNGKKSERQTNHERLWKTN